MSVTPSSRKTTIPSQPAGDLFFRTQRRKDAEVLIFLLNTEARRLREYFIPIYRERGDAKTRRAFFLLNTEAQRLRELYSERKDAETRRIIFFSESLSLCVLN